MLPDGSRIRNVDWQEFKVTVDSVEALSGYDLLALLRDDIEILVESNLLGLLDALVGRANRGIVNSLRVKIDAALNQLANGNRTPAANQLEAVIHEIDAMVLAGSLTAADVAALRAALITSAQSISN